MDREEFQKAYAKLVAKAWEDDDFKQRLLTEPMTVFKENGIDIPEDLEIRVFEQTHNRVHLILPSKPSGELTEEELDGAAGGRHTYACVQCIPETPWCHG